MSNVLQERPQGAAVNDPSLTPEARAAPSDAYPSAAREKRSRLPWIKAGATLVHMAQGIT